LKKNSFSQIILISDGIRTDGKIPHITGDIRVFSIGVGKNLNVSDLSILNVEYKPVVYQDKEQYVVVRFTNKNTADGSVKIRL